MDKTRRSFSVFLILCGLIIGIVGSFACVSIKSYKGLMPVSDSRASQLMSIYPIYEPFKGDRGLSLQNRNGYIVNNGELISYDILDFRSFEGLDYSTNSKYVWIPILVWLFYSFLGINGLLNKKFLFERGYNGK